MPFVFSERLTIQSNHENVVGFEREVCRLSFRTRDLELLTTAVEVPSILYRSLCSKAPAYFHLSCCAFAGKNRVECHDYILTQDVPVLTPRL